MKKIYEQHFTTPLGAMLALADDDFLYLLEFEERKNLAKELAQFPKREVAKNPITQQIESEVRLYFAGKLRDFKSPIKLSGTAFRQEVWQAVRQIPFGARVSYQKIAQQIGRPQAQMAVGSANGANQLALIVPCHRVLRSNGALAGYAAGLWRKEALLAMEKKFLENQR